MSMQNVDAIRTVYEAISRGDVGMARKLAGEDIGCLAKHSCARVYEPPSASLQEGRSAFTRP